MYGIQSNGRHQLTIETNAGVLTTHLDFETEPQPRLMIDCPKIDLVPADYQLPDVVTAMGLKADQVDWDKPLMLEKTNNYLYLASSNLKTLEQNELDVRGAIDFA